MPEDIVRITNVGARRRQDALMAEISKTADQALVLLLRLSDEGPCTPAELARMTRLNRTVVHRLLSTLHGRGFVVRHADGYMAGGALVRMAARVQPELRGAARETITELADQLSETVVMHILDGDDAVVLQQAVAGTKLVRVEHHVGSRHALHAGASGRALLAFMRPGVVERIVARSSDPEGLERQLAGVRALGYEVSHDELQQGVHGLAVPVLAGDHAVASLAILVPANRAGGMTHHVDALRTGADRISEKLAADTS